MLILGRILSSLQLKTNASKQFSSNVNEKLCELVKIIGHYIAAVCYSKYSAISLQNHTTPLTWSSTYKLLNYLTGIRKSRFDQKISHFW